MLGVGERGREIHSTNSRLYTAAILKKKKRERRREGHLS